jgi:hypothetical protein
MHHTIDERIALKQFQYKLATYHNLSLLAGI